MQKKARTYTMGNLASALLYKVFTGKNGAGACTLAGTRRGDVVVGVVNLTDAADGAASYEAVITVDGQIQQSSASDLSTKKFAVLIFHES